MPGRDHRFPEALAPCGIICICRRQEHGRTETLALGCGSCGPGWIHEGTDLESVVAIHYSNGDRVIWSVPAFKALVAAGGSLNFTVLSFKIPGLHEVVIRVAPVVAKSTPYAAIYTLDLLSATGTGILISALLSMVVLGISVRDGVGVYKDTLIDLTKPIFTIACVLGFAFIANYSGISSTLALASTGQLFPFFAPMLGWLGVFLTGSDTSSNALFS